MKEFTELNAIAIIGQLSEENKRLKKFIISLVKEYGLEEWLTKEHQELWDLLNDKKEPGADSESN